MVVIYSTALKLFAERDVDESLRKYVHVEPPRPVLQVIQVKLQPFQHLLHGIRVTVVQGGVRRDTRADLVEVNIPWVTLDNLVYIIFSLWPRTDESHVTFYHVPQLRQLVQVVIAQEMSNLGHTLVVLVPKQLRAVFLRVHAHAAELVNGERSAETPDTFLLKDSRPAIFAFNKDVAQQKCW